MAGKATIIAGIVIPSDSPSFLTFVGLHVLVALACVITGVVAMLSNKRPGQHPMFGTIYYWCLSAVFASATVLSAMRWADDYHLFILGMLSFAAATAALLNFSHIFSPVDGTHSNVVHVSLRSPLV